MPTYLGYQVPQGWKPIDFAGMTASMITELRNIEQEKEAQREKIDQGILDSQMAVNQFQLQASKTHSEVMFNGADAARQKLHVWEKQMKSGNMDPREFKRLKNNMMLSLDSYNTYMQEMEVLANANAERMASGAAGWFERDMAQKRNSSWFNFGDQAMMISDTDGKMVIAKVDENGNVIDALTESQMQNLNTYTYNKYDIKSDVKDFVEGIGVHSIESAAKGGWITETGQNVNPKYKEAVEKYVNSHIANDDRVADILLEDNGAVYSIDDDELGISVDITPRSYYSKDELKSLVDSEINKFSMNYKDKLSEEDYSKYEKMVREKAEKAMLGVYLDANGNKHIEVNDTHRDMVEDALKLDIETRLGYKESFQPKASSSGSNRNKSLGAGDIDPLYVAYTTNKVFYGELSKDEYLNPQFSYTKNADGSWTIKKKSTTSKEYIQKMVDANVIPEAEWTTETGGLTITNAMQMSPFTKGASESTRTQYNRGMNFYKDGKWLEIPYMFQEGRQVKPSKDPLNLGIQ